jgi:tetratricopeptide (TPR) repeat protein
VQIVLSGLKSALGVPGRILNLIDWRRRWAKVDRAEIEGSFSAELQLLQDDLNDCESDEERAPIQRDIARVRSEVRSFHRARREILLSRSIVERMAPKGAVSQHPPARPNPDKETLHLAIETLARLQPAREFAEHFIRGNAFYEVTEYEKALKEYEAALRLRPEDPSTLTNRGAAFGELGRHEEALADHSRSLEIRPDDPSTLNNRGNALAHLDNYEGALADHNRSLEIRPDDPNTLYNRGNTLARLNRYEEVLADYDRALELRPDDPSTLTNRGATLGRLGRCDEALADFTHSLELRPDHTASAATKRPSMRTTGHLS